MCRRPLVSCLLALVVLWASSLAHAQSSAKTVRIGLLSNAAAPPDSPLSRAFRGRLAELGYVEGQTMILEARYAEGRPERFPALTAELIRSNVSVLVTVGSQATRVAKDATATIPIVFTGVANPIAAGIVPSLAHPGSNVTGITDQAGDVWAKLLDLLKETSPKSTRLGVLTDPANPGSAATEQMARRLGYQVISGAVRNSHDLEPAFAKLVREGAQALVVSATPALVFHADRVAEFARKQRLPAITSSPGLADAGLLLYYGTNWADIFRRAAEYVDRVLKGTRAGDLPVEQAGRFELIVNMKTAKAIGVTIPAAVLVRADRVIE